MNGVFQIDRELFENSIWNNITEFRLFFYILGNAVWKQGGARKGSVEIKRGQYLRSYRNLCKDLMYLDNNAEKYYNVSTIKRAVDRLVRDGRLEIKETELGTLFTVVNYDVYQGFERFDREDLQQPRNSHATATQQPRNNKNKDNKDNNSNNMGDTPTTKVKKHKYGEFGNVLLADSEVEALKEKLGEQVMKEYIRRLDEYVGSKGVKYKSHYLTILKWHRDDEGKAKPQKDTKKDFNEREYDYEDLEKKLLGRG